MNALVVSVRVLSRVFRLVGEADVLAGALQHVCPAHQHEGSDPVVDRPPGLRRHRARGDHRISGDHPPRSGDHRAPLPRGQVPVVGAAERVAGDAGELVANQRNAGQVEQISPQCSNRSASELGVPVPVLGVAVMGVVGPPVVRVGVDEDEPADEADGLVQSAGPEGGEVIALVLGGVEEVDEKPLEQEQGHAPPRAPRVVHRRAVESDRTPVAGEVEECRSIAPAPRAPPDAPSE